MHRMARLRPSASAVPELMFSTNRCFTFFKTGTRREKRSVRCSVHWAPKLSLPHLITTHWGRQKGHKGPMWGLVWGDYEMWNVPMGVLGPALFTVHFREVWEPRRRSRRKALSQQPGTPGGCWPSQSPDATGSTPEQVNQGASLPRLSFTSDLGRPVQGGQSNHQWQLPLDPRLSYCTCGCILSQEGDWGGTKGF